MQESDGYPFVFQMIDRKIIFRKALVIRNNNRNFAM